MSLFSRIKSWFTLPSMQDCLEAELASRRPASENAKRVREEFAEYYKGNKPFIEKPVPPDIVVLKEGDLQAPSRRGFIAGILGFALTPIITLLPKTLVTKALGLEVVGGFKQPCMITDPPWGVNTVLLDKSDWLLLDKIVVKSAHIRLKASSGLTCK